MDSSHHKADAEADAEIDTRDASGELYSTYFDQIYRYVIYEVRDKAITEYLTQEIFLEAWRGSERHEWDGPQFSACLYRIAQNRIPEYFRANPQNKIVETELPAGDSDLERGVDANRTEQLFVSAISCLPKQQRQVIVLKFIEGVDALEIGQVTGKMQGMIKMLQMQALAAFAVEARHGVGRSG
jgi:RNA polymerase sigma-70 factor, ECF subfamily